MLGIAKIFGYVTYAVKKCHVQKTFQQNRLCHVTRKLLISSKVISIESRVSYRNCVKIFFKRRRYFFFLPKTPEEVIPKQGGVNTTLQTLFNGFLFIGTTFDPMQMFSSGKTIREMKRLEFLYCPKLTRKRISECLKEF